MRIIFDRSAFHGDRFQALSRSPLRKLVDRKLVLVFLTPIFIEETASTFGRSGPEAVWRERLTFALDICNGRIFQEKVDIWHSELVESKGLHANYLLPERESRRGTGSRPRLVEVLRTVAATGDIRREWLEIREAREESLNKKMRLCERIA